MAERIGEILVRKKIMTQEQLDASLKEQALSGEFLGEIFIKLGFVKETDLLTALAEQFHTRFVDLGNVRINPVAVKMTGWDFVAEFKIMPLDIRAGILLIAVSNPLDMWPLSVLREQLKLEEVNFVLATKEDIARTVKKYYGEGLGGAA